ncbi:MAG: cytidylate kinase-like family protein [Lachnospiraceae bacterium]|nr:cytidylate kinase-like family protein [Lachnospiraceae bacterium]
MEQNIVITIARQFGSGGKTVGQMLAKDLGIKCYDKEVLRMASDESGINEALFHEKDEKLKRAPLFEKTRGEYKGRLISPSSQEFISDNNLFNYQAKIIRDLADKESCVVIGRAADYVLKDFPGLVSVFVHAPRAYCVSQAIERCACRPDEAEKFVEKTDKARSDFYNYYTGNKWNDARNYDLCLNSQRLGFEGVLEAIKAYIRIRFGELPNDMSSICQD